MIAKRSHTTAFAPSTSSPASQPIEKTLAPIFRRENPIKWVHNTASFQQIVYGSPKSCPRPALFDLDGTLIKGRRDWAWWDPCVPQRLRELVEGGTAIYVITNQGWTRQADQKNWRERIEAVLKKLDTPLTVLVAPGYDWRRKPMPGLWADLVAANKVELDKSSMFLVGDAAGRDGDHSACDSQWAQNVGIAFKTPEEYFHNAAPPAKIKTPGYDIKSAIATKRPLFTPANTPVLPSPPRTELVVFVGLMGSGKSTFFRQHFQPAGYFWANSDTLGGIDKSRIAATEALQAGKSVVVDNTSPSVRVRGLYIALAKQFNVPIRAFHFDVPERLGWHNNLYRAFAPTAPMRSKLIPSKAFAYYASAFEKPTEEEGFDEVKTVFPRFRQATPEAQAEYEMYLSLAGAYSTIEVGFAERGAGKPQDYNRGWKKGR